MSRIYPVKAERYEPGDLKEPPCIGIFTVAGYWLPTAAGLPHLQFHVEQKELAEAVAAAINEAHLRGRTEVKTELCALIGAQCIIEAP